MILNVPLLQLQLRTTQCGRAISWKWLRMNSNILREIEIVHLNVKNSWTNDLCTLIYFNHRYIKRLKVILCSLERKFESVSTSNHMFGTAIWDELPKCIFENFKIAWVKREQFQNFQKSRVWFIPKIARTKHMITE